MFPHSSKTCDKHESAAKLDELKILGASTSSRIDQLDTDYELSKFFFGPKRLGESFPVKTSGPPY